MVTRADFYSHTGNTAKHDLTQVGPDAWRCNTCHADAEQCACARCLHCGRSDDYNQMNGACVRCVADQVLDNDFVSREHFEEFCQLWVESAQQDGLLPEPLWRPWHDDLAAVWLDAAMETALRHIAASTRSHAIWQDNGPTWAAAAAAGAQ